MVWHISKTGRAKTLQNFEDFFAKSAILWFLGTMLTIFAHLKLVAKLCAAEIKDQDPVF